MTVYLTTLLNFPLGAIGEFKRNLKSYNDVLSGHHQEDACECLMVFIDILDEGTKHSLVSGVADDDTVVSFTKTMFTSVYLKTFTCKGCYNSMSSHWMSRMLSVSPAKECSIEQLLQ